MQISLKIFLKKIGNARKKWQENVKQEGYLSKLIAGRNESSCINDSLLSTIFFYTCIQKTNTEQPGSGAFIEEPSMG